MDRAIRNGLIKILTGKEVLMRLRMILEELLEEYPVYRDYAPSDLNELSERDVYETILEIRKSVLKVGDRVSFVWNGNRFDGWVEELKERFALVKVDGAKVWNVDMAMLRKEG